MKYPSMTRFALLLCSVLAATVCLAQEAPGGAPADATKAAGTAKSKLLPWLPGLEEGQHQALSGGKPLLVRAGADWCTPCRKLAAEIEKPVVQQALARWMLVYVDVDRWGKDAKELNVTVVPALRLCTSGGRPVASHDGYLSAEALVAWLEEHYEGALATPDAVLLETGKPDPLAVVQLVRQFGVRDPAIREAAIRRLLPYPQLGRAAVVKAFGEGNLATRLAALELLHEWQAPVEEMDPWRPQTMTEPRTAALEKWIEQAADSPAPEPEKLTDEQIETAHWQIDRMLKAAPAEAVAIRDRLARLGPRLLPEVYAGLKQAASDRDRERLLALRYRLVTGDSLVLRWPGGLARLAATDFQQRQRAAEELAKLAGAEDQPLLLELFSDPDPLVREISLRGLQRVGGKQATAALVRLLADPEPNVRAAVLNQLAEKPSQEMVPKVAEYLENEKDSDLVVHAIRFLRAAKGPEAVKSLVPLLKHARWQVRAEAAEALGNAVGSSGTNELKADAYVALIDLLEDADAFVVSRAVSGLSDVDMAVAVDPLIAAAKKHPDLAASIVEILSRNDKMRVMALPHLREFAGHEDAAIRAAALGGLYNAAPNAMEKELAAGLNDRDGTVRIAAASVLFRALEARRSTAMSSRERAELGTADVSEFDSPFAEKPPPGLMTRAIRLLGIGRSASAPADDPAEKPNEDQGMESMPFEVQKQEDHPPPGDEQKPGDQAGDAARTPADDNGRATPPVDPWDQWLREFYAGKGLPVWMPPLIEPLEKMLRAEEAEDRVAAAKALVPLGKGEVALPALLEAAGSDAKLLGQAAGILPWLVWDERLPMFQQMRKLARDPDDFYQLVYAMTQVTDRRAVELFWELLADEKATVSVAYSLERSLRRAYYGEAIYDSQSKVAQMPLQRREVAEVAAPWATAGSEWQRVVGLALLLGAAPEEAAAPARQMTDDPQLSEALRNDAFQVLLAAQPKTERMKMAIAALSSDQPARRKLVLTYLVQGSSVLRYLRGQIPLWIDGSNDGGIAYSGGQPIIPEPPPGLEAEHVRPLVDDSDPEVAAYAGYLLALFGDPAGLEKLLSYWRMPESEPFADQLNRLVYRAIAVLDDSAQIPVLEKIRAGLEEYEVRDFYWTIRIMTGPEILRFRKRIRDEVGVSNLR